MGWGLNIYFLKLPKVILHTAMILKTIAVEARTKSIHVEIIPRSMESFPCGSGPRSKLEVKYYNKALL